ncbi:hypothetical protein MKW98_020835 [Papaver atlanticum]|uniref:Protein MAK16 homolog n=1 Tax=Papaver atlanticum TaxID=357466 RepID=A0AAD4XY55_9MAGN|nr:hypothetical protein MKW98_020835 [Papaver atlanticum]
MQHDEVIWQVIRHNHCSFMSKIETGNFCRNPYNLTGICNRSSCPLANSRYATIREDEGVFYLYMKTIERSHMPGKLWERLKLPKNYEKALEIIDKNMMYWPKYLVHKIKQRLTKMTQMRIRMRKLVLKTREKVMTMPRKEGKREKRREEKALHAAQVEKGIEKEVMERLKAGLYGDIHNVPAKVFKKILDKKEEALKDVDVNVDEEPEIEYVEMEDGEFEMEDDMEDFGLYDNSDDTEDEDEDDDDEEEEKKRSLKESVVVAGKRERRDTLEAKLRRKMSQVVVEVENDAPDERQTRKYRVV